MSTRIIFIGMSFYIHNFIGHQFKVQPKTIYYANYFGNGSLGDVTISTSQTFTSSVDGNPVIREYNTLTLNASATMSINNRCKGMVIYVRGNCTINGMIDMSGKGAVAGASTSSFPEIYVRKNTGSVLLSPHSQTLTSDNILIPSENNNQASYVGNVTTFNVPRAGAAGAAQPSIQTAGVNGVNGVNGQCGGGGGGSSGRYSYPGTIGGSGSCYGGGAGGGGAGGNHSAVIPSQYSGIGGTGIGQAAGDNNGGGGAGNPPGPTAFTAPGTGVGGVIYIIVGGNLNIGASAKIQSTGSVGGGCSIDDGSRGGAGGGSGGGSITLIYGGTYANSGTITANGGLGGTNGYFGAGGTGGNGSIRTAKALTGSFF